MIAVSMTSFLLPATAVASPGTAVPEVHALPRHASSSPTARTHTLTLPALPSAQSERNRLRMTMQRADFQPTGYYLPPDRPLTVTAHPHGLRKGAKLELQVSAPGLVQHDNPDGESADVRTYPLREGTTTVTDPKGGVLSVRYVTDKGLFERVAPRVTIAFDEAAEPLPFYVLGHSDEREWRAMLERTEVPYAQLVSDRVIVTARTSTFREQAPSPHALLSTYDEIVGVEEEISGLDGETPSDVPTPLRHSIVEGGRKPGFPYASDQVVSIPTDSARAFLTVDGLKSFWGGWHEIGHHHQLDPTDWPAIQEVSVNLYSLAVQRHFLGAGPGPEHGTLKEWEDTKKFLEKVQTDKLDYNKEPVDDDDYYWYAFERLVMYEQLRVAFGDHFYPALHKAARTRDPQASALDKQRFFMVAASQISGRDLTDFFTKWGWINQLDADGGKARMEIGNLKLPPPKTDLSRTPVYGATE
ncbi:M60 family metallopeptidase [Streptoalloteichus hindustanus]|uniref:M60 family metallopeptidase n=1 Tax=Streptoalloteichus hindustanus TaxID=2017 RepID=UPI00116109F7|nr:M60 family metallopeptidase [Streptoalloteichus hindustanus]